MTVVALFCHCIWGMLGTDSLTFRALGHKGPHGRHDREKSITQRSFVSLSGNVKYTYCECKEGYLRMMGSSRGGSWQMLFVVCSVFILP